ncbi:MAG TPA: RraA family protein [archaeon]|nr:RraA family protein [archaeon]
MKTIAVFLLLIFAVMPQAHAPAGSDAVPAKYMADAAEQLTGRRAHMTNEIHLLAGKGLAGPAVTLRIVRDESASRTTEGYAAIKVIEDAPAGSVLVEALDDEKDFAVFGATLAVLAKSRGLAGFVGDGAVRNMAGLKRVEFPVFARGAVPGSAAGHYKIAGVNVPVWCGGIEVMPGDYVVADDDGVAVAPKERYAEVLASAKKMQDEDQALLPLIEKYGSFTKAWQELHPTKQQP